MSKTMAYKNGYELHHYFPKVAEESGFAFNTHRPRLRVDWHKIRMIDIENVIRERRFPLIEQHINDILNCVLESEFDVRILDEGVLKMFRLAQLAVEYQQFCRHYLDRSVYVLREEITALAKELDVTKKELREKDEEIRRLRKKSKYTYRTPLPFGNDNIATMILKTLTNKGDIFPTASNEEAQYNKCSYCDKVFMNQLYLKGHISRRHASISELPEKDQDNDQNFTNDRENLIVNNEIAGLKEKLKEMENRIKSQSQENVAIDEKQSSAVKTETGLDGSNISVKLTKDAEVSTNNDDYLLNKIEEWKREEHEKYNKELNLLRNQLIETLKAFKDEQRQEQNDISIIEQLHITIKQQGAEIIALKNELSISKMKSEEEEIQRKKEAEAQVSFWSKRIEAQSKQYEALLKKLNDMTQELQESRVIANKERDRAIHLEELLQENLADHQVKADRDNLTKHVSVAKKSLKKSPSIIHDDKCANKIYQSNNSKERKSLQSLHRKAEELLSIAVSSSDVSNASANAENINIMDENAKKHILRNNKIPNEPKNNNKGNKMQLREKDDRKYELQLPNNEEVDDNERYQIKDNIQKKIKKSKSSQSIVGIEKNGIIRHGSPLKIVRAKITEEVNNRLITAGVDPLKSGLAKNIFQKRRMHLQQEYDAKSKKNPKYQKVKHSILTYLDSNSSIVKETSDKKQVTENPYYISPSKTGKIFNLTSVISNVKNKAKSLVKTNDMKVKRNALNAEVAKKAMSLLKTPPESLTTSPVRNTEDIYVKDSKHYNQNKASHDKELRKRAARKRNVGSGTSTDQSDDLSESEHENISSIAKKQNLISVDSLIKSPARRPSSASANMNGLIQKLSGVNNVRLPRTQSETNLADFKIESRSTRSISQLLKDPHSDAESSNTQSKKSSSEENLPKIPKQTKGVLKNASSNSSLNKKKVLFDMDAIQMKSVSASPSQSITDKSNSNEKFELGLINLDNEEWDISSIENDIKNDTKIQLATRTSPKIAELKHTIESQLARRNETPTALVGGVDVLAGRPTIVKTASIAGSNTSLGSSILDDSDAAPVVNNKAFRKPKPSVQNDESDLDLSEYSLDGITINNNNKKDNGSF